MGQQVQQNLANFQGAGRQQNIMRESIMSTFNHQGMRESNYSQVIPAKILTEDPRKKNKRENPLFYSTCTALPHNQFLKKEEELVEGYKLSKTVLKVLKGEEVNLE